MANGIGVGGPPGILSIQPQYWGIYAIAMLVAIVVPPPCGPCWSTSASRLPASWIWPRPDPHNLGGSPARPLSCPVPTIRFQPMSEPTMTQTPWWQSAVILPDLPQSFQDSGARGCGTGDLKGIAARLDYLKTLGVDALWLTPVYVSPGGQRLRHRRHYLNIDPAYGTMTDFEGPAGAAHARGIRIVMDIVVNHTPPSTPGSSRRWGIKQPLSRLLASGAIRWMAACPTTGNPSLVAAPGSLDRAHRPVLPASVCPRAGGSQLGKSGGACRGENIIHFWAKKGGRFPPRRYQPHLQIRRSLTTRWGWPPLLHRRAAHPRIFAGCEPRRLRPVGP